MQDLRLGRLLLLGAAVVACDGRIARSATVSPAIRGPVSLEEWGVMRSTLSLRGGGKPSATKGGILEEKEARSNKGPRFRAGLDSEDCEEAGGEEEEGSNDVGDDGGDGQYLDDNEEIDEEEERLMQDKHKLLKRAVLARPFDTEALNDLAEFAWDSLGDIGGDPPENPYVSYADKHNGGFLCRSTCTSRQTHIPAHSHIHVHAHARTHTKSTLKRSLQHTNRAHECPQSRSGRTFTP